jgi:hypothetical protein
MPRSICSISSVCSGAGKFVAVGVDPDALALRLQQEGAEAFSASWAKLLECISRRSALLAAT